MKRLHVHVSVDNLADSIRFYSGMFASAPTVVKTDYAKWMLDDPRVNFAISRRDRDAGLNHLGIQVESGEELQEMEGRLQALQTPLVTQENASCCYAKSDKHWVEDPSGIAWETFHTLDSIPVYGEHASSAGKPAEAAGVTEAGACCVPLAKAQSKQSCCGPKTESKASACC
ncbi:ArsI/CadI family heavy metal resistance metalloenzyme [Noviherbaspirillum galbum]|uniref:Glyoxalase/bleomycin resistance/dioxygenase family protein n=1 Tax=Noviherbaspirillum galbum TaxID=2709383 RepID=A0A6B3SMU4_9BURK|nr:ArsI/CadI family heavy metal resistance metalloenzyme [Noviherbaspirillum galbum]NEX62174.1 glyoxalase/bleomycin resistance/dioxygenase family protein [Noviherbaspirillum galbum]